MRFYVISKLITIFYSLKFS